MSYLLKRSLQIELEISSLKAVVHNPPEKKRDLNFHKNVRLPQLYIQVCELYIHNVSLLESVKSLHSEQILIGLQVSPIILPA